MRRSQRARALRPATSSPTHARARARGRRRQWPCPTVRPEGCQPRWEPLPDAMVTRPSSALSAPLAVLRARGGSAPYPTPLRRAHGRPTPARASGHVLPAASLPLHVFFDKRRTADVMTGPGGRHACPDRGSTGSQRIAADSGKRPRTGALRGALGVELGRIPGKSEVDVEAIWGRPGVALGSLWGRSVSRSHACSLRRTRAPPPT